MVSACLSKSPEIGSRLITQQLPDNDPAEPLRPGGSASAAPPQQPKRRRMRRRLSAYERMNCRALCKIPINQLAPAEQSVAPLPSARRKKRAKESRSDTSKLPSLHGKIDWEFLWVEQGHEAAFRARWCRSPFGQERIRIRKMRGKLRVEDDPYYRRHRQDQFERWKMKLMGGRTA